MVGEADVGETANLFQNGIKLSIDLRPSSRWSANPGSIFNGSNNSQLLGSLQLLLKGRIPSANRLGMVFKKLHKEIRLPTGQLHTFGMYIRVDGQHLYPYPAGF